MGMERLLRFLGTHEGVFERVDDSGGRVQDVYRGAVDAMAALAPRLSTDEADALPEAVMARLGGTGYGYLVAVAQGVASHLPPAALERWDALLATGITEHAAKASKPDQGFDRSPVRQWGEVRQAIADARGDLDGFISLEAAKHPNLQNTIQIAKRLLSAGRAAEALDWVRRTSPGGLRMMRFEDIADETGSRDPMSKPKTLLEARILEALGRGEEAQALRRRSSSRAQAPPILSPPCESRRAWSPPTPGQRPSARSRTTLQRRDHCRDRLRARVGTSANHDAVDLQFDSVAASSRSPLAARRLRRILRSDDRGRFNDDGHEGRRCRQARIEHTACLTPPPKNLLRQ